jgi:hypothetical protein
MYMHVYYLLLYYNMKMSIGVYPFDSMQTITIRDSAMTLHLMITISDIIRCMFASQAVRYVGALGNGRLHCKQVIKTLWVYFVNHIRSARCILIASRKEPVRSKTACVKISVGNVCSTPSLLQAPSLSNPQNFCG